MWFLAFLKGIPIKDFIYLGIFVALIGGFIWYTHHERVIGAQMQTARVHAVQQRFQKKVDAINKHNSQIEKTTNEEIKGLSINLAVANRDLAKRVHNDTSRHRAIIVPETSCVAEQPTNTTAAPARTKATTTPTKRVAIDKNILKDDLNIALAHNEQLQAIIKEFKNIK